MIAICSTVIDFCVDLYRIAPRAVDRVRRIPKVFSLMKRSGPIKLPLHRSLVSCSVIFYSCTLKLYCIHYFYYRSPSSSIGQFHWKRFHGVHVHTAILKNSQWSGKQSNGLQGHCGSLDDCECCTSIKGRRRSGQRHTIIGYGKCIACHWAERCQQCRFIYNCKLDVWRLFWRLCVFTCLKCVEENYDIPRSHQLPYNNPKQPLSASTHLNLGTGLVATSTPNLSADIPPRSSKDARHFYTNAAPTNLEGNVFRYDFDEQVRSIFSFQTHCPKYSVLFKGTCT